MELFWGQTPRTGPSRKARGSRDLRGSWVFGSGQCVFRAAFIVLLKSDNLALPAGFDWPRLLWTEVITCHLRRPPVASALAALHGIRRGLHAAPPAPAHAFVSDLRRLAPRPAAGSGSERPFRPLEEG